MLRLDVGGNSAGPVSSERDAGEFAAIDIDVTFGTPSTTCVAKAIELEVIKFTQKHGYQLNEV